MDFNPEMSHRRIDLIDCIERLPEREREFIELWEKGVAEHGSGTLSQTEIAAKWKMSNATVTNTREKALLLLRKCMSEKGYGP